MIDPDQPTPTTGNRGPAADRTVRPGRFWAPTIRRWTIAGLTASIVTVEGHGAGTAASTAGGDPHP